jgi:hypothetical protein
VQGPTTEQVNDKLRAVSWRRLDRDIVAAGFFKKIHVREGSARIDFELRTPRADKIDSMSKGIRQVVSSPRPGSGLSRTRSGARSHRPGRRTSLSPAAVTVAASGEQESTAHGEPSGRVV